LNALYCRAGRWDIATHKEDLSPEELQKLAAERPPG